MKLKPEDHITIFYDFTRLKVDLKSDAVGHITPYKNGKPTYKSVLSMLAIRSVINRCYKL